ncbi:uncharacterized protein LOC130943955 isoform X1 [Arachis stenosperma]|uniref:uncharacterized protein LOC130943955 isoform X1 n=1 Tax=Arachis stenosperma TaxID=217475 RepID=UPI0025AD9CA8|nr:uncharacterized protein LOC130943955 isoform X1 [Arachis stenosperma]
MISSHLVSFQCEYLKHMLTNEANSYSYRKANKHQEEGYSDTCSSILDFKEIKKKESSLMNMLKQAVGRIWKSSSGYALEGGTKILAWSYVPSIYFHNTQAHTAPRSFFGVEDFLDDDNSKPYTYQKGKKSKNPHKHVSFKQRTVAYMEPFTLDVFISKRFVSASLTHRVTSKQVAVSGTNSKDIKAVLKSRSDIPACIAIGRILAERAREADVYTASYTPRDRDKFEGKIRAVVQSLIDNGIDVKVYLD